MGAFAPTMSFSVAKNGNLSKGLWFLLLLTASSLLALYYFLPSKSYFIFDSEPAFYAATGFVVPFFVTVVTRIGGYILRRPRDYWINPTTKKNLEVEE